MHESENHYCTCAARLDDHGICFLADSQAEEELNTVTTCHHLIEGAVIVQPLFP